MSTLKLPPGSEAHHRGEDSQVPRDPDEVKGVNPPIELDSLFELARRELVGLDGARGGDRKACKKQQNAQGPHQARLYDNTRSG